MPEITIDVKKTARIGKSLAISRALGALLLVAACVWGVSRLGEFDPPPPEIHCLEGVEGTQVWWIEPPGDDDISSRHARIVVSRLALEEPRRGVISLPGGGRRVLPPRGLILVHRDGRLEAHPLAPEVRRLFGRLRRVPPKEGLQRWFSQPEVRGRLASAGVDLGAFWD